MSAKTMLPFRPWLTSDGTRLPFEARLYDTSQIVTINPDRIAYLLPGPDPALTTYVHFGCGQPLEIVCPYRPLAAYLQRQPSGFDWIEPEGDG